MDQDRAKSQINREYTGSNVAVLLKIRDDIPKSVVMQYNVVRGFPAS
jgi:hypothetical protein